MRENTIQKVLEKKLIAIVRGVYGGDALRLAEALYAGGISLIEFTFDQKNPETAADTQQAIRGVNERFAGAVLAGAGTVTTCRQVELAQEAGARYIISPNVNAQVIARTRALGMVSMPGAFTASEVLTAHESGADFVKLFPAGSMGVDYFKALRGPINHVRMLAVGGVNLENIGAYLKAGAVGAGLGGNLVNKQWIEQGKFGDITALAQQLAEIVEGK